MKRIPLSVLAGGIVGILYLAITVAIVAVQTSLTGDEPFLFILINPHTAFMLGSFGAFSYLYVPIFLAIILNFLLGCGIVAIARMIRRRV